MSKTIDVICLSGGLDSTTLLTETVQKTDLVYAVAFKYPSKHNGLELNSATVIAEYLNVPLTIIDLSTIFAGFSSTLLLDNSPIPEGHYTDDSMKSTVVPLRNIIFATVAAAGALDFFSKLFPDSSIRLGLGVHAGDHTVYPDCRPTTMKALCQALLAGSDHKLILETPYIHLSKVDIAYKGIMAGAPYRLTRTCYTTNSIACGKCGSCIERLEAFALNDTVDPIPYQKTS